MNHQLPPSKIWWRTSLAASIATLGVAGVGNFSADAAPAENAEACEAPAEETSQTGGDAHPGAGVDPGTAGPAYGINGCEGVDDSSQTEPDTTEDFDMANQGSETPDGAYNDGGGTPEPAPDARNPECDDMPDWLEGEFGYEASCEAYLDGYFRESYDTNSSTTVPETTTPETTAPETTVPETTAPETTVPETTTPETTVPETTAPETTAPETTAPETGGNEQNPSCDDIPKWAEDEFGYEIACEAYLNGDFDNQPYHPDCDRMPSWATEDFDPQTACDKYLAGEFDQVYRTPDPSPTTTTPETTTPETTAPETGGIEQNPSCDDIPKWAEDEFGYEIACEAYLNGDFDNQPYHPDCDRMPSWATEDFDPQTACDKYLAGEFDQVYRTPDPSPTTTTPETTTPETTGPETTTAPTQPEAIERNPACDDMPDWAEGEFGYEEACDAYLEGLFDLPDQPGTTDPGPTEPEAIERNPACDDMPDWAEGEFGYEEACDAYLDGLFDLNNTQSGADNESGDPEVGAIMPTSPDVTGLPTEAPTAPESFVGGDDATADGGQQGAAGAASTGSTSVESSSTGSSGSTGADAAASSADTASESQSISEGANATLEQSSVPAIADDSTTFDLAGDGINPVQSSTDPILVGASLANAARAAGLPETGAGLGATGLGAFLIFAGGSAYLIGRQPKRGENK